jgi:Na+-transporting methylmalonyl-CoA/oxaloacetate decarboxylase gamma subunit
MEETLQQSLRIVAVGIVGVFANLLLLMAVVTLLGKLFGKKPTKKAAPPAGGALTQSGDASASRAG